MHRDGDPTFDVQMKASYASKFTYDTELYPHLLHVPRRRVHQVHCKMDSNGDYHLFCDCHFSHAYDLVCVHCVCINNGVIKTVDVSHCMTLSYAENLMDPVKASQIGKGKFES